MRDRAKIMGLEAIVFSSRVDTCFTPFMLFYAFPLLALSHFSNRFWVTSKCWGGGVLRHKFSYAELANG
jgi:hypothetical protein